MSQAQTHPPKTLADKWEQKIKPWFDKHGLKLGIGVGVGLLALIVFLWLRSSAKKSQEESWGAVVLAATTGKTAAAQQKAFSDASEQYDDKAAGQWAKLRHAQLLLSQGLGQALSNPTEAGGHLRGAREEFEELYGKSKIGTIRERALFGLAQAREATSAGDLKEAIATYEKFLTQFPDSIYSGPAKKHIELLKQPETAAMYAFLAKYKPPEKADPTANEFTPITMPTIPDELRIDGWAGFAPGKPGDGKGPGKGAPGFPDDPDKKTPLTAPRPGGKAPAFPPEDKKPAPGKP